MEKLRTIEILDIFAWEHYSQVVFSAHCTIITLLAALSAALLSVLTLKLMQVIQMPLGY